MTSVALREVVLRWSLIELDLTDPLVRLVEAIFVL